MTILPLLLSAALSSPAAVPFAPGERMSFAIEYLGMRMGTAAIDVGEPSDGLVPLQLEAHTTGLAGAVYDFQERLVSHVDPQTGLPARFILDTDERGRVHHDVTDYDHAGGQAVVIERGKTTSTDRVPIPPETVDFVALVFQLRRMPLEPGARRTFAVLSGKRLREVIVEVMTRERVETPAGTFDALKIRVPTGFTGAFSEKHPTVLWLSDDDRRIVVRLSTDFSFGGAVAELRSYRPGRPAVDGTARAP